MLRKLLPDIEAFKHYQYFHNEENTKSRDSCIVEYANIKKLFHDEQSKYNRRCNKIFLQPKQTAFFEWLFINNNSRHNDKTVNQFTVLNL
jgi:hypothetical protein